MRAARGGGKTAAIAKSQANQVKRISVSLPPELPEFANSAGKLEELWVETELKGDKRSAKTIRNYLFTFETFIDFLSLTQKEVSLQLFYPSIKHLRTALRKQGVVETTERDIEKRGKCEINNKKQICFFIYTFVNIY